MAIRHPHYHPRSPQGGCGPGNSRCARPLGAEIALPNIEGIPAYDPSAPVYHFVTPNDGGPAELVPFTPQVAHEDSPAARTVPPPAPVIDVAPIPQPEAPACAEGSGVDMALRQRVANAIHIMPGNNGDITDLLKPGLTSDALILMLSRLVLPAAEGGMGDQGIGASVIWTGHHNDLGQVNNPKMVKDHSAGAAIDITMVPDINTPGQTIHVGTTGPNLASTEAFIDDNIQHNTFLTRLGVPHTLFTPARHAEAVAHGITIFDDGPTHVHLGVTVPQDRFSIDRGEYGESGF